MVFLRRSCEQCRLNKRKCRRDPSSEICLRCQSLGLHCVFEQSNQGKRNDLLCGVESSIVPSCAGLGKSPPVPIDLDSSPTEPSQSTENDLSLSPTFHEQDFSDFSSVSLAGRKNTSCGRGHRHIFEVQMGSNQLKHRLIRRRIGLSSSPKAVAFVQSTQLDSKMIGRDLNGLRIAFSEGDGVWYLGNVSRLVVGNSTNGFDGVMSVYQWTGPTITVNQVCVPQMHWEIPSITRSWE